jgi:DNA-directed RNA polymerase subunit M/transcription elongation factor TFIIS
MDWLMVFLGLVVGFIAASKSLKHEQRRTAPAIGKPIVVPRNIYPPPSCPPRPTPGGYHLSLQLADERVTSKALVEAWRKSVLGLIRLAVTNLQLARSQAEVMNSKGAVEAAATSIENVSRALLHCYGEKPDLNSGQEEPLRLLARRLQGEERAQFEKAIDEVGQLYWNKTVEAYISEKSIQTPLLNEARTQQILETATKIVAQFRRIMDEHFGTEIAELCEKCTKCGSLNISVWAFDAQEATYQCNICGYKWIQPRQ